MAAGTFTGAGASMGLAGVGGTVATYGQEGIQKATSYLPAAGSVAGAGLLMGAVHDLGNTAMGKKKKKRRY